MNEQQQDQVKAKAYQRSQLGLEITEQICTLLFLLVWVVAAPLLVDYLGERNRYALLILVSTFIYVSYQLALFVLDYLGGFRLEHKYGLSTETLEAWLWRHAKMVVLAGLLLGGLMIALYTAFWYLRYWYLWCWLGWIVLSVLLAQVFPVIILPIFYPSERLDDPELMESFVKLSEGTGITVQGIYRLELSKTTRKGNAMLTGVGRTRRVLLGDTLLDRLTPEQLKVIYAHELGHHVHRHFLKMIGLHALMSSIVLALLYLVLHGAQADYSVAVARLPVVALTLSLFSFLSRPIAAGASRHFERQSDEYALERTGTPGAFIEAFDILASQNLADLNPPRWVVIFYHDHPPIGERIAMAQNWVRPS